MKAAASPALPFLVHHLPAGFSPASSRASPACALLNAGAREPVASSLAVRSANSKRHPCNDFPAPTCNTEQEILCQNCVSKGACVESVSGCKPPGFCVRLCQERRVDLWLLWSWKPRPQGKCVRAQSILMSCENVRFRTDLRSSLKCWFGDGGGMGDGSYVASMVYIRPEHSGAQIPP